MSQAAVTAMSTADGRALPAARHLDMGIALLAFWCLPLEFTLTAPIRWPAAALIAGYLIYRQQVWLPNLRAALFPLAFALVCLASALWSDVPATALRHGIGMGLIILLGATLADRLGARGLAKALLLSQGVLALASLAMLIGGDPATLAAADGFSGVFPHKNVLGQRMLLVLISAFSLLLIERVGGVWKIMSIGAAGIALLLIAQSQSGSAILLAVIAIVLGLIGAAIWVPAQQFRGGRAVALFALINGASLTLFILINGFGVDPARDVLDALGKDETLTGRTAIWQYGWESVRSHPWLGTGAGNFWRLDHDLAVRIAAMFGREGDQFYMHNSFLEVLVQVGLVGLFAFSLSMAWAVWVTLRASFSTPAPAFFSLLIVALLLVRSIGESFLFYPFNLGTMVFWAAVLWCSNPAVFGSAPDLRQAASTRSANPSGVRP